MATQTWRDDPRLKLMDAARKAQAELDTEAEQAAGVTYNQALVLALIEQSPEGAMVSRLAPLLQRAVHTLTAAVSGLEKKGLVDRVTRRGEDKRIVRITLTSRGRDALAKLRASSLPLP